MVSGTLVILWPLKEAILDGPGMNGFSDWLVTEWNTATLYFQTASVIQLSLYVRWT